MRFDNLKNLCEIYDSFIADCKNYNFEDTEQALENFENFLLSIEELKASSAKKIYEQALLLSSVLEQQGFMHGLSKGVNLKSDVELVSERK